MHFPRLTRQVLTKTNVIPNLHPKNSRIFRGKLIEGNATDLPRENVHLKEADFLELLSKFNHKIPGKSLITHSPFEDLSSNINLATISSNLKDTRDMNPLHSLIYVYAAKRDIYNLEISPWIRIGKLSAIVFEAFLQKGGRSANVIIGLKCMIKNPSKLKKDEEIRGISFNTNK